jgi:hypothetical protein
MDSGMIGPNIFSYTIQKNEFLAKETDLCQAFNRLQKVIYLSFANNMFLLFYIAFIKRIVMT